MSGTISGLPRGTTGLVLASGSGVTAQIAESATSFSFGALDAGSVYAVTVESAPSQLTCTVAGGSGTLRADVSNVVVTCSEKAFTLGGSITLAPDSSNGKGISGLVLANGSDTLSVPVGAGSFTMPAPVASASSYQVTVKTQPVGMSCAVSPTVASTMPASNVTTVTVMCTDQPYPLGGTVTLNGPSGASLSAQGLTLTNTANGDQYTFGANASTFTMAMRVPYGGAYVLSVTTQPANLTCAVNNPSGIMPAGNVALAITCATRSYALGGMVVINGPNAAALSPQGLVLTNTSNGDTYSFTTTAASFTMPLAVPYGAAYSLAVMTQPPGLNCTVNNPSATMPANGVANVIVNCSNQSFTLGGSITGLGSASGLVLTNQSGDSTTILANATGFNMNTVVPYGAAYSVAVSQSPATLRCSAANGTGVMPAANVTAIVVSCTPILHKTFLFAPNANLNSISVFAVDAATGALSTTPNSPATTGASPNVISVSPNGKFLYSPNYSDGTLSGFAIDPVQGSLAPVPGSPYAGAGGGQSTIFTPSGNFLYVVDGTTLRGFGVDANTGALTPVSGSPYPLVGGYASAINPQGTLLYVANYTTGQLYGYSIDPATGSLIALAGSPFAIVNAALGLGFDPTGANLYISTNGNGVGAYSIDPSGVPTALPGSPYGPTQGGYAVSVDSTGNYVLVASSSDGKIYVWSRAAGTGTLSPTAGSPFAAVAGASTVLFDASGLHLYVYDFAAAQIAAFNFDAQNGTISPVAGSPIANVDGGYSLAIGTTSY
ncbi:MAG: beta-propeller fold lactonase family protein [Variovorax sp.]